MYIFQDAVDEIHLTHRLLLACNVYECHTVDCIIWLSLYEICRAFY